MVMTAADGEPCDLCGGRGWVLEQDGGAGVARPCACRKDLRGPRLLAAAAIPPRFRDRSLRNFDVDCGSGAERDQRRQALEESRAYVDQFITAKGRFRETGLLFIGRPGVGKTHLAAAVLSELVRRYHVRGLFVDFTALLHEIRASFDPGTAASSSGVIHPVTEAEVAVIDDLGAQRTTDWVREILYLILNTRYVNRLPTLFTTNYRLEPVAAPAAARLEDDEPEHIDHDAAISSPAARYRSSEAPEIEASGFELLSHRRLPPTLVSRLYEMARPIVIEAGDYRKERLQKQQF